MYSKKKQYLCRLIVVHSRHKATQPANSAPRE